MRLSHGSVTDPALHRYQIMHITQFIKKRQEKRNTLLYFSILKDMVTEVPILQLTNTVAIYKYSDAILKHMESDALKTFQNDWLYSK